MSAPSASVAILVMISAQPALFENEVANTSHPWWLLTAILRNCSSYSYARIKNIMPSDRGTCMLHVRKQFAQDRSVRSNNMTCV